LGYEVINHITIKRVFDIENVMGNPECGGDSLGVTYSIESTTCFRVIRSLGVAEGFHRDTHYLVALFHKKCCRHR
jgi:hypothetical protein